MDGIFILQALQADEHGRNANNNGIAPGARETSGWRVRSAAGVRRRGRRGGGALGCNHKTGPSKRFWFWGKDVLRLWPLWPFWGLCANPGGGAPPRPRRGAQRGRAKARPPAQPHQ